MAAEEKILTKHPTGKEREEYRQAKIRRGEDGDPLSPRERRNSLTPNFPSS